jgi:rhamnosyltransferase
VVTVAIPVLNGRRWLPEVFAAVHAQQIDHELDLLVCDSGSVDGSVKLAERAGARVLTLAPGQFHHSRTRNLLLREARGEFVAMLTQDAQPTSPDWLATLLRGFEVADRVALVYGPYLPRPDCPPLEASRLRRFFTLLSPDGSPRVDRVDAEQPSAGLSPERGYFTDANGCIRREAWEQVQYPLVPYAEDHALAHSLMSAGWAKVFMPDAGVLHSHHYTPTQQLRRAFDDYRGLREVYDYREPFGAGYLVGQLRGAAGAGLRGGPPADRAPARRAGRMIVAVAQQGFQLVGAILGSRADRLPAGVRRRLSLERRATFEPIAWDQRCT